MPELPKRVAPEFIQFTVDAALLRELGERLVGKPFVALAELVKNSYDADATRVQITFGNDFIEVSDNGDGMSRENFRSFWMRIGTTHKQSAPLTSKFHRRVSGSKGIGRLSVQFLGNRMLLWSVPDGNPSEAIKAEVDWRTAREAANLVTAGANVSSTDPATALSPEYSHGTRIRIEGLNQDWDKDAIRGLARELWFLQPPKPIVENLPSRDEFVVELNGAAAEELKAFNEQLNAAFQNWIAEIEGTVENGRKTSSASVTVRFSDGASHTQDFPLQRSALDAAWFRIRVYKLTGKQPAGVSVHEAREYFRRFGGVHIYDQGFRLPFYGGEGEDWLRLEIDHSHRMMVSRLVPDSLKGEGDLRDLPTNGRIFGVVRISTSHELATAPKSARARGAYLNIQLSRDRLIDNDSLADLRDCVRWGLDYYSYLTSARKSIDLAKSLPQAVPSEPLLEEIQAKLAELSRTLPARASAEVLKISEQVKRVGALDRDRTDRYAKERILLAALATAGMSAIALEHELGKEIHGLTRVLQKIPRSESPVADSLHQSIRSILQRITAARRLLSPLMEPMNRDHMASLDVRSTFEGLVNDLHPLLRSLHVDITGIKSNVRFPPATRAAWSTIFQNVLVNALNATLDTAKKRVAVSADYTASGDRGFVRVEDNGAGVELATAARLFEPFERRLEISRERMQLGLGGVGLGLTIVKMVADSVACDVRFVEPSPGMTTAFELSWKVSNEPHTTAHRPSRRRH